MFRNLKLSLVVLVAGLGIACGRSPVKAEAALSLKPLDLCLNVGAVTHVALTETLTTGEVVDLSGMVRPTCDDPSILSIDAEGLIHALAEGEANLHAVLDGLVADAHLVVSNHCGQPVTCDSCPGSGGSLIGISVSPIDLNLSVGASARLTVRGTLDTGVVVDLTGTVLPTCDSSILAIDASGVIHALAAGQAIITVNVAGILAQVRVNVTGSGDCSKGCDADPIVGISLSPLDLNLAVGASADLTVWATLRSGVRINLTGIVLPTCDDSIIAIDALGRIRAIAAGHATVRVLVNGIIATVNVNVSAASLVSVTLFPTSVNLAIGASLNLRVLGTLSDGTIVDLTREAVFTCSNPLIATLNATLGVNSVVTGLLPGSAIITATVRGQVTTCPIVVVGLHL